MAFRRTTHNLAAVFMLGLAAAPAAADDTYPAKEVEISVGQPAGGILDVLARIVAEGLNEKFGQPFLVVNRPGGGGNIAGEYMENQEPDGYSLLVLGSSMSFREALGTTPFTFPEDFTTIARIGMMASVVAVPASLPVETLDDLAAYTKEHPGEINFSSAGIGSGAHIFTMALMDETGADLTHIPFTGGPAAVNGVVSGDTSLFIGPLSLIKSYYDNDELKILASATPERLPLLPDVPTTAEQGHPDFLAEQYIGIWGPKGMPEAFVQTLNDAVNDYLAKPEVIEKLNALSIRTVPESADEFRSFLHADVARWTKVVSTIKEGG